MDAELTALPNDEPDGRLAVSMVMGGPSGLGTVTRMVVAFQHGSDRAKWMTIRRWDGTVGQRYEKVGQIEITQCGVSTGKEPVTT